MGNYEPQTNRFTAELIFLSGVPSLELSQGNFQDSFMSGSFAPPSAQQGRPVACACQGARAPRLPAEHSGPRARSPPEARACLRSPGPFGIPAGCASRWWGLRARRTPGVAVGAGEQRLDWSVVSPGDPEPSERAREAKVLSPASVPSPISFDSPPVFSLWFAPARAA